MDAKDYYERGNEYLEKENYSQAIAEYWKAMELIELPYSSAEFRRQIEEKAFELDVVAVFLNETLYQHYRDK